MATTTTATISNEIFEQRMADAEAAKEAGNAALARGNAKSASFHYKRVYLYLAEMLPDSVAGASLGAASSSFSLGSETQANDDAAADGLIGFLQKRRTQSKQQQQEEEGETAEGRAAVAAARDARVNALYGASLNNLVLADFKLGRFGEGVAAATCLLDRVPGFELSPKALLRRAHCHAAMHNYDKAEADAAQLEQLVGLAAERVAAAASSGAEADEKGGGAVEAIEGLGGMTVAAVAAMGGDVAAVRATIARTRKEAYAQEKKTYQKIFSHKS